MTFAILKKSQFKPLVKSSYNVTNEPCRAECAIIIDLCIYVCLLGAASFLYLFKSYKNKVS